MSRVSPKLSIIPKAFPAYVHASPNLYTPVPSCSCAIGIVCMPMQYHATSKYIFFIIQSLSRHINYSVNLILIIDMPAPLYTFLRVSLHFYITSNKLTQ
jgi:hypothetical protein